MPFALGASCFFSLTADPVDMAVSESLLPSMGSFSDGFTLCLPLPLSAVGSLIQVMFTTQASGLDGGCTDIFLALCPCIPIPAAEAASSLFRFHLSVILSSTFHLYHPSRSFHFHTSLTSIFLSKVSASGVPQGPPSGTCLVIFFSFWGAVAPDPKTLWSGMKK